MSLEHEEQREIFDQLEREISAGPSDEFAKNSERKRLEELRQE